MSAATRRRQAGTTIGAGQIGRMEILFVAGFAPIVRDPAVAVPFYRDTIGLPLATVSGDYVAVDSFGGTKHLGVWPLADAAMSCLGTADWPEEVPVPQATIEFEGCRCRRRCRRGRRVDRLRARADPRGAGRTMGPDHHPPARPRRPARRHLPLPLDAHGRLTEEGRLDSGADRGCSVVSDERSRAGGPELLARDSSLQPHKDDNSRATAAAFDGLSH